MPKKPTGSNEKTCAQCGYKWNAKVQVPKFCPSCHNPRWEKTWRNS